MSILDKAARRRGGLTMGTTLKDSVPPEQMTPSLYERDFAEWASAEARLLREGRFEHLDVQHLAEEIEDMGKNDARALRSALVVVLAHLLKLSLSPARHPRSGWKATVLMQRSGIEDILRDSPSLRAKMPGFLQDAWPKARRIAKVELEEFDEKPAIPEECPFSLENVIDPGFLP